MTERSARQGIYFSEFHHPDGTPRLARSAVLFVDLLGVRAMARSSNAGNHAKTIARALEEVRHDLMADPPWPDVDSPWPAVHFSDSLLVAMPIIGGTDGENSVGAMCGLAGSIQTRFAQHELSLRGGLSVGDVHISGQLVFGPGLVEAYDLENLHADVPRIILSREALDIMESAFTCYAEPSGAPQTWELLIDEDSQVVVDYLTHSITEYEVGTADEALEQHRAFIAKRLREHRHPGRTRDKYLWAAQYHNWVCERMSGEASHRFAELPERTLRTFAVGVGSPPTCG